MLGLAKGSMAARVREDRQIESARAAGAVLREAGLEFDWEHYDTLAGPQKSRYTNNINKKRQEAGLDRIVPSRDRRRS